MNWIKKGLFALGLGIAALGTLIYIGSIDSDSYDDLGLQAPIEDVPDERNGYTAIAYMFEDGFEMFSDWGHITALGDYAAQTDWDDAVAAELLSDSGGYIDSAILATASPQFKFEMASNPEDYPSYLQVRALQRLLILKTMVEARAGDMNRAVELIANAITFSQLVKTESRHLRISYLIGSNMEAWALQCIQRMLTNYPLSDAQTIKLQSALASITPFSNDGFRETFSPDFQWSVYFLDDMTDTSLPETWRRYKSLRENWKILEDSNQDSSLKAKVSGLIATFLPRYALHKNEMLEWVAKMRYEESIQTDYYCDQVTLPLFLDGGDISWATALAPYSNEVLETLATAPSPYRLDFTRRCLSHTYVESVKTLLAISLYQKSHHSLPNSLTELVPTYLDSLP